MGLPDPLCGAVCISLSPIMVAVSDIKVKVGLAYHTHPAAILCTRVPVVARSERPLGRSQEGFTASHFTPEHQLRHRQERYYDGGDNGARAYSE